MLAAAGPDGIPREKLAALLWPESDEEHARAALKQLTYTFRRVFGAEAVLVGATSLSFDERVASSVPFSS